MLGGDLGLPGAGQGGKGGGMGGKGQGEGGKAPEGPGEGIKFSTTRPSGKIDPRGLVIASRYFRGLPEKGEAAAEYRKVFRAYESMARNSLSKESLTMIEFSFSPLKGFPSLSCMTLEEDISGEITWIRLKLSCPA